MIESAWPDLTVLARGAGEVDPFEAANARLFRGEEAFAPGLTGWKRWSRPSPEPRPDPEFRGLLLASIEREAAEVAGMVARLADRVARSDDRPPILIAILRAGVPVGALLARRLAGFWGEPVPLLALSLFGGLGWDEAALAAALQAHPGRPVWFVDGWTSGGGVASELWASFGRWREAGRADFTDGLGPRLAVLCDPRGVADASATRADRFVPSAGFTAPETLGFSRGFVREDGGMFRVYGYPRALVDPAYARAWMAIGQATPSPLADREMGTGTGRLQPEPVPISLVAPDREMGTGTGRLQPEPVPISLVTRTLQSSCPAPEPPPGPLPAAPPVGWRIHVNEVVRALINRDPREVRFRDSEPAVRDRMAGVLQLCRRRGIPAVFDRPEVGAWGALAAARMTESSP